MKVAKLDQEASDKLQATFMDHRNAPHIRELGSYPMQLAILLHLLYRRQILPQQRTELYREYLKTFLDREQRDDKEPLLAEERRVIEDIHAFIGWHLQAKAEEGAASGTIARADLRDLLRRHLDGRSDGQDLAEKLFSAISGRVLCLVERDTGYYQFEVQSLREYFAALYIFENAPSKGQGNTRDDCLDALLERTYWSNVCRFFVGMFSKVEVRGIHQNLEGLSARADLELHPQLRASAALFLDDRTYEGQADKPIRDVVDFIFDGPGVVLAEDGLLDGSGSPLSLSERGGRLQAVQHLKARLVSDHSVEERPALTASLRRHSFPADDLSGWWWENFVPTMDWVDIASRLGILGDLSVAQEEQLGTLVLNLRSETVRLTGLLVRGLYDGQNQDVLAVCVAELNAGVGDAIDVGAVSTPVHRLVHSANIAQLRLRRSNIGSSDVSDRDRLPTRIKRRRGSSPEVFADIIDITDQLKTLSVEAAELGDWRQRVKLVSRAWGQGWVLSQLMAVIPDGVDIDLLHPSTDGDAILIAALQTEQAARAHTKDAQWWKTWLSECATDLERSSWIYRVLTLARPSVLMNLTDELNEQVNALVPPWYKAIERSLVEFATSPLSRRLAIGEELRLRSNKLGGAVLWLLRVVANDSAQPFIDTRLTDDFESLLSHLPGDQRDLVRIVGMKKTVRVELLHHKRRSLPNGGWTRDVKLGVLRPAQTTRILKAPHEWPADIVQRAVEKIAVRLSERLNPLAVVAERNSWFEQ